MAPARVREPLEWVASNSALVACCGRWQSLDVLALDTEFLRRSTFYPIPALIQCFDGERVSVIDPLAIDDWQPLSEVLTRASIRKVLHAGGEDLEVFWRLLGEIPSPLFDTQIAAGLCGLRPSMGYHKLVEQLLGVALAKDETQSDWLARPLSENQLRYAADDVIYLFRAAQNLEQRARELGRLDWVLEDGARIGNGLATLVPVELSYLRVKGASRLGRRELAVLRSLCEWRECQARCLDKPRNWLVKDASLLAMATARPDNLAALGEIDGLMPSTIRKQGDTLLTLVNAAKALPEQQLPVLLPSSRAPALQRPLKVLQEGIRAIADDLSIASELLLSRRQCDAVLASWMAGGAPVLPGSVDSPWRLALLQDTFSRMERP